MWEVRDAESPATLLAWRTSGGVATNPWEVDDMAKAIARIFKTLVRLLMPAARGRHRAVGSLPAVRCGVASALVTPRVPGWRTGLLRGEDTALMRPYVLTREERQERRLQYALRYGRRQVAPGLVVGGIDAGPRWIRGVEVAG